MCAPAKRPSGILRNPCGNLDIPMESVGNPWGVLGSYIQSLHALCGILYGAYTACVGSYTEPRSYTGPTRPVWGHTQSLHS
eukprot:6366388-Pyramimonas_sp.AAC.1